jgi:hypothetical protein
MAIALGEDQARKRNALPRRTQARAAELLFHRDRRVGM